MGKSKPDAAGTGNMRSAHILRIKTKSAPKIRKPTVFAMKTVGFVGYGVGYSSRWRLRYWLGLMPCAL